MSRVLLIGAVVTLIVLLVNVSVSLATDSTSILRWLAAPVLGVAASVASAVAQTRNPADDSLSAQERLLPRQVGRFNLRAMAKRFGQRLGKTTLTWGIVLGVIVVGCAGGAAAIAGHLGMGWVTGNEHGPDRLVRDTNMADDGLTVSVTRVEHTPHYTRVWVTVSNETPGRVSLPIAERNCLLIGGEGTVRAASAFRSDWTETIAAGGSATGVVTFDGHLPAEAIRARLAFEHVYAEGVDTLTAITVSGIPLRPPS